MQVGVDELPLLESEGDDASLVWSANPSTCKTVQLLPAESSGEPWAASESRGSLRPLIDDTPSPEH